MCLFVHLQIPLWLLWLGFVNAGVAPPGTRIMLHVGVLSFNTRRYARALRCLRVCVCVLCLFYHIVFAIMLASLVPHTDLVPAFL